MLSREITVFGLQSSCALLNVCARKYPCVCLNVSGPCPHSLSSACHWSFLPAVGPFPSADLPSCAHWGPSVGGRPFAGSLLSRGGKSFPLALPQSIRKAPGLWGLKEAASPAGPLAGLASSWSPARGARTGVSGSWPSPEPTVVCGQALRSRPLLAILGPLVCPSVGTGSPHPDLLPNFRLQHSLDNEGTVEWSPSWGGHCVLSGQSTCLMLQQPTSSLT